MRRSTSLHRSTRTNLNPSIRHCLPWRHHRVTWITCSPLWRSLNLRILKCLLSQNNTFFKATASVVKDAADDPDCQGLREQWYYFRFYVRQHILISVIIFVAYKFSLPLNMEKPHYRSQRAGEWSLIRVDVSRPIYRPLTYIAVALLGPHQPRYIESNLYCNW